MANRLSKITTRLGDDGKTHLGDGVRLYKDHPRIEALGTIDEVNCAIGMVVALMPVDEAITQLLLQVQQDLFDLGGELCPPYRVAITADKVQVLDQGINTWNQKLPPLKEFILPGGNIKSAACHLARVTTRRAERTIIRLHQQEPLNPEIVRYLNRLSDLLFIIARLLMKETDTDEVFWEHIRRKK